MSTPNETTLARIRAAIPRGTARSLKARPATPAADALAGQSRDELLERFALELRALGGEFHLLPERDIASAIVDRLNRMVEGGAERPPVLAWQAEGLPILLLDRLRREGIETLGPILPATPPERTSRLAELGRAGMGLTGAEAALAETGTLVMRDGPGRGRLASLLPPVHVAIIRPDQVHATFETYLESLRGHPASALDSASAVTLITGPSRTADIEMTLTIGVHGPKELVVYCLDAGSQASESND